MDAACTPPHIRHLPLLLVRVRRARGPAQAVAVAAMAPSTFLSSRNLLHFVF